MGQTTHNDLVSIQLGLLDLLERRSRLDEQIAELKAQRKKLCDEITLQRGAIWHAVEVAEASTGNNDLSVEDGEDGEPPEAAE